MTLTGFLLARIAEDEETARAATRGPWSFESAPNGMAPLVVGDGMAVAETLDKPHLSDARFIARHDPARVLAECAAKRRVIARHSETPADHWDPGVCAGCGWSGDPDIAVTNFGWDEVCPELADIAAIYADHPDYDKEWKP